MPLPAAAVAIPAVLKGLGVAAAVGGGISSLMDLVQSFKGTDAEVAQIVAKRDEAVAELVRKGLPHDVALAQVNAEIAPQIEAVKANQPSTAGALLGLGASVAGLGAARGGMAAAKAAFGAAGGGLKGAGAGAKALGKAAFLGAPKAAAAGVGGEAAASAAGNAREFVGPLGQARMEQMEAAKRGALDRVSAGIEGTPRLTYRPGDTVEGRMLAGVLPQPDGPRSELYEMILHDIMRGSEAGRLRGRMYGVEGG